MEREAGDFLPEHIREALKRKSSRDPNSRFQTKLHLLLSYSSEFPNLQDRIGLMWTSDDEFKMNKITLSSVMNIKLNTINVNLRDLNFEKVERDKEGWTRWRRVGFTRTNSGIETDADAARRADPNYIGRAPTLPFQLGKMSHPQCESFVAESQRIWVDLLQCSPTSAVPIQTVIERSARHFRYNEQPLENAREVIEAIMVPALGDLKCGFADLCRFLAMFGPANTLMLKIASLLTCSNQSGKWLTFESGHQIQHSLPYASFDDLMPNCLIVHHGDGTIDRVFNDPNMSAIDDSAYLFDDHGKVYKSWNEYFAFRPVKQGNGIGAYRFS
jgi:hypothetical protein